MQWTAPPDTTTRSDPTPRPRPTPGEMDSDQRRKRKRLVTRPIYRYFFSVRPLLLCLAFVSFLYFLSHRIPVNPSAFKPILVVSALPLLSSSQISSFRHYRARKLLSNSLKIEDRVLFPDHVLLLVSNLKKRDELECVYFKKIGSNSSDEVWKLGRDILSVDEYSGFQSVVRCPIPPLNYSAAVGLEGGGRRVSGRNNGVVHSWETLAYAAELDGETAVVFVKGLNHRADRESDPAQFGCHWEREGRYVGRSKAVAVAQEVVRCLVPKRIGLMRPGKAEAIRVTIGVNPSLLPRSVVGLNPAKAEGIRVRVGVNPSLRARGSSDHVLVPSVAKVFVSNNVADEGEKRRRGDFSKYELCVCTMVWNQAPSLREWIMYHAWLGVEKWFIYDNNSDDQIKDVIEQLELEDYNVSRHVWPWIKTQEAGFSHCALKARDECNWVGFMDVDEFFYFPFPTKKQRSKKYRFHGQNSLRNLVMNISSTSPRIAEIRTACHSFGPSGLSSPPPKGVTIGYTCRLQSPERHKSIVRPDALDKTLLNVVHHFHLRKGFRYLNLPQGAAVINHYKYQVWESFRAKFFRRVATYVADWQENQNEGSRDRAPGLGTEAIEPANWHLQFCEVWDTGMRDFVFANFADSSTGLLPWERNPLQKMM
ncbi:hypothetical protein RHSIM_Rhsim12G0052400 [Rhododendron simsii]|uniref:Glycosyltransferase family 92 protein n=1 Tax=Rhododendron simsii TaxID=118357 RepID=A0A834G0J3_RHOSS|nr:hypothetical protein RHSIM_Rhsim12G0052400 [Rhododendron simsii]